MKISTKGRYAIKLMLDLATYHNGEPVSLKDIATRQGISEKYLEHIVSTLSKAGLVKSMRGSHGGYMLTDSPQNYTTRQILNAVEGSIAPVDCVGNNGVQCDRRGTCVSVRIWQRLYDAMNGVLEEITLTDLIDWQNEMSADQYVI